MNARFAFPRRTAAFISLIITAAVAMVCIHHARQVQAQDSFAETEQLQNEFGQLSGEVMRPV